MESIIYPKPLQRGDKVAVVAPAGAFDHTLITPALDTLHKVGFQTVVMPNVTGRHGTYSGTADQRFADFRDAWFDPSIRAIICARGGYGAVHLLPQLAKLPLNDDPKWLVGFSDISALHALLYSQGIASLHASMLKGLARGIDNIDNRRLIDALMGESLTYRFDGYPLNRNGEAHSRIIGGNLAVLSSLISTPYDMLKPHNILYIEDINEPLYKVERTLWQLKLNGVLANLDGLVVGQFTNTKDTTDLSQYYEMIDRMVEDATYPIAFNVPIGHIPDNIPVINGANAILKVCEDEVTLEL